MADIVVKQHDTYPPLRGAASDQNGLMNLATASSLKLIIKGAGATVLGGTAIATDPATTGGYNWSYSWKTVDTATVGSYSMELEITWDANTSPPRVETVPADSYNSLDVKADLA